MAHPPANSKPPLERMRLDKWLWAARFYKTRSLATEEIGKGRVRVNGAEAKPAREVKPGDEIALRQGPLTRTVAVLGLSHLRGPAPVAQALYAETADSQAQRAAAAERQRLAPEPALSIDRGRPTKRDRRAISDADGWGDRWSARFDND